MLVVVEIPFVDARPFVADEGGRLRRPPWPLASATGKHFVRYLGPTRERLLGGVDPWPGEGAYCDVSNAVRLSPALSTTQFGRSPEATGFRCQFRRYLHNGEAVARFDVGLVQERYRGRALDAGDTETMLNAVLDYRVAIRSDERADTCLARVGVDLAELVLRATTQSRMASKIQPWWFQSLPPLLLVEYHTGEVALPRDVTIVLGRRRTAADPPFALAFKRVVREGRTCHVWFIERFAHQWRSDLVRNMRVHLQRLHAEFEVLNHILGLMIEGRLPVSAGASRQRLLGYIGHASGLLSRTSVYGNAQTSLLSAAYDFSEVASPGRRATLQAMLQQSRPALAERVERLKQIIDVDEIGGGT